MKPDSDAIYAADDHYRKINRLDPESREIDDLHHHYTGDIDSCVDHSDVPWLDSIEPEYLVSGKAELHFTNGRGKQHQYRISLVSDENSVVWFVDYNVNPASLKPSWKYLGILNPDAAHMGDVLVVTRASGFDKMSLPARVFRHFVTLILYREALPQGYKVRHAGRCSCCGRPLKSDRSVKHGIGPKCRKYAQELWANLA